MKSFREIKGLVILLLIPAILVISFNTSVNRHYHITSNGLIIEHAHPFLRNTTHLPFQKHKHTKAEFIFLSFSVLPIYIAAYLSLVLSVFVSSLKKYRLYKEVNKQKPHTRKLKARAPPSSFFFYSVG